MVPRDVQETKSQGLGLESEKERTVSGSHPEQRGWVTPC